MISAPLTKNHRIGHAEAKKKESHAVKVATLSSFEMVNYMQK
jgi:hypothetical protein